MKFPLSALALLFLLCPPGDAADLFDAEDSMLDMSQYLAENRYGFLPVPLAITEPAIGYGGGLFGLFLHGKGSREGGQFIPPPLTAFGGAATQNGTWFIGGGHRHTWRHDRIRYLAGAGYANVNLDIYSGDTGGFSHAKPVQTQTKG
ncbi:TPA: glyceraldehyde-3-phosphate dehydrogenase, partial [Klebsiella variicola subsp. variicola]|nr:glyceraldehyde-3-phosphate dehydrogenase [Klebsiella variicola subsp. variicola]